MNRQYRQGDVLLCAIDSIPKEAKPVPRDGELVVAQGELSGHAHVFAAAEALMLHDKRRGHFFLRIGGKGARLCHEEHEPILIPPGSYELRRQREYRPRIPRFARD